MIVAHARRAVIAAAICVASVAACSFGPEEIEHLSASNAVTVDIVDEDGNPVIGAAYDYGDLSAFSDKNGEFDLQLAGPVAGVVTSAGKLAEPLVVSPTDR